VTESTPNEAIEPIAQVVGDSAHVIDLESAEVTPVGDPIDVVADESGHSYEPAVNDVVDNPEVIPESVTDDDTATILPGDTAGSPPVEPVPAIEESEPVAGTENEAVKDTGAAGGTVAKDVTPKPDQKPNRKLGWRAYILGGSGGTK
jgi:hypothetical protein